MPSESGGKAYKYRIRRAPPWQGAVISLAGDGDGTSRALELLQLQGKGVVRDAEIDITRIDPRGVIQQGLADHFTLKSGKNYATFLHERHVARGTRLRHIGNEIAHIDSNSEQHGYNEKKP